MKHRDLAVPLVTLMLAVFGIGSPAGLQAQSAPEKSASTQTRSTAAKGKRTPVPERFIIIATRLPDAPNGGYRQGRSRILPALDSYGTPVRQDQPRLATGSFIPQKFNIVGSGAADTATPLFLYTQGDLRAGGISFVGGPFGQSYSDSQVRLTAPRYALDLHRVPPEKRMAVLTQLVGPERARQAMDDAYAAATVTR